MTNDNTPKRPFDDASERIAELEAENIVLRAQVAELEAEARDLANELYDTFGD